MDRQAGTTAANGGVLARAPGRREGGVRPNGIKRATTGAIAVSPRGRAGSGRGATALGGREAEMCNRILAFEAQVEPAAGTAATAAGRAGADRTG